MAVKYANFDKSGGGTDGLTKTSAWETLAQAAAGWANGDDVYCTGTDTMAAAVDVAGTTVGTIANGGIRLWSYDATLTTYTPGACVLDGNGAATNIITCTAQTALLIAGFDIKNATGPGINNLAGDALVLYDCKIRDHGGDGIDNTNEIGMVLNCTISGNGGRGIYRQGGDISGCIIKNNTLEGINTGAALNSIANCIIHNNGGTAGIVTAINIAIINNTIDGNAGSGISLSGGLFTETYVIRGNRITRNGAYGLVADNTVLIATKGNAYYLNTSGAKSIVCEFNVIADVTMASDGYTDRANDDFTLTAVAEARNTGVQIGCSF